jgi:PAS domain S-box-containing protein
VRRPAALFWPLLVGTLALALTGWLAQHERRTQQQHLRESFDLGLRQTVTRIEQRLAGWEQMLRGVRGLFDASDEVTREDFSIYVDTLLGGPDFAGLRNIAWSPQVDAARLPAFLAAQRAAGRPDFALHPPGARATVAPVTYAAPDARMAARLFGFDPLSDPVQSAAMLQARDAGTVVITGLVPLAGGDSERGFMMVLPLYARGRAAGSVAERRASLVGWVTAGFRIGDLMSSLYGEGTPGLDVRIYDGARPAAAALIYGSDTPPPQAPHIEASEYLGFGGHTWTVAMRSGPEFEQRFSNDAAPVIALAGGGLGVALALLTWLLVTGRERAYEAARTMTRRLRDSAERYRGIVQTASEGIWTVDAQGNTDFVNPKLEQLLGYAAQEMLGRRRSEFLAEPVSPGDTLPGTRASAAPGAEPPRLRFRRKDGSDLWATLATSPITDAAGRHAGELAMVTDVTDRQHAEARRAALESQLRQSQKMEAIGTLAGGIAHDFNNVLASILGNVALLQHEVASKPGTSVSGHPRLEQIATAAARARSLVQQITAFSRQQPQQLRAQPLQPLLEETVQLLRSTMPARVEIDLRIAAEPLPVEADATQLQQVLMNLCTNAWHALPGGAGHIVIGLEAQVLDADGAERIGGGGRLQAGAHAHLWVEDDGAGMDEATRLRIFEPFFTTKPVGQGTGLGLAVVHGIVASHRGAILVHSTPGRGSCFDIWLPLAAAAAAPPAAAAGMPAMGHGEHVLYVDDDIVMALMVEGLMRQQGFRITCLTDPQQALALLRGGRHDIDVVVTDYNMPELSGLDLAQALAGLHPGLPVIISSGHVSDALRAEAQRIGVRHLLQKEYTLERLAGLVQRVLGERRSAVN